MAASVKIPSTNLPLAMETPLPPLGMDVVRWPFKLSKTLQDWAYAQLHYPLGTIIQDVVDGHPVMVQIQVHDTYGAHPEWGIKLHKGTSIFSPATRNENMKLVAMVDPPTGWPSSSDGSAVSGEFGGFKFQPFKHLKIPIVSPFLQNAVKTAGRAVGSASHAMDKVTGKIMKGIEHIPVAGPLIHGVLDVGNAPFRITEEIGRGKRLDRAAMSGLKELGSGVHEVAPYAQTIVALVPGVGTAASAAIGAAAAIAEGQPLDDIAMSAVAGTVPGGAFAKTGYDIGKAALKHKPIGSIVLKGLGDLGPQLGVVIPDAAKDAIGNGLNLARHIASGLPVDPKLVEHAIKALPEPTMRIAAQTARNLASHKSVADVLIESGQQMIPGLSVDQRKDLDGAMKIGMAMGHAQHLQALTKQIVNGPAMKGHLANVAKGVISRDTTLQAARGMLKNVGTHGFDQGVGMMQHQITPYQFHAVRSQLAAPDRKGFDVATALHIGRVAGPPIPIGLPARMRVGYHVTHGMLGAPVANKVAMMTTVVGEQNGRAGATAAIKEIALAHESWWKRLLEWLGLADKPVSQETTS
jgi:hypothetical protein